MQSNSHRWELEEVSFEEFFSDSGMESLFIKKKKSGLLTCSLKKTACFDSGAANSHLDSLQNTKLSIWLSYCWGRVLAPTASGDELYVLIYFYLKYLFPSLAVSCFPRNSSAFLSDWKLVRPHLVLTSKISYTNKQFFIALNSMKIIIFFLEGETVSSVSSLYVSCKEETVMH